MLLIASAIAFSSAITAILINWQKNVIQHPYWGKIFLFRDGHASIWAILLNINNQTFVLNTNSFIDSIYQKPPYYFKSLIIESYFDYISFQHSSIFCNHYKSVYDNAQFNPCAKRLHGH